MPNHHRWAALAVLLVAEAMNLLDATIVQVAAPAIHAELGGPATTISWYSAAYTLPFALLLVTGGRLGDIAGRRRVFRIGVAVFTLASAACALAPSPVLLLVFRAIQGAAAALVIPQTIGLIRAMFDGPDRAKALGAIGPVMGLAAVCGPVLGGVLTQAWSWRAVFLVTVPLGLAVFAAAGLLVEDRASARPRLDLVGTALVAAGAGLVVYPLVAGWHLGIFAGGLVLLVVFGFHQRWRRDRSPLIEAGLFRDAGFPAALLTSVLFFAVMNGLMQVVVLHLQVAEHAGPRTAGLTLLPWSAGLAVSSWVAGTYFVPRFGGRLLFAGLALLAAGVAGLAAAFAAGWSPLVPLAVGGLGIGLFTVPFFTVALHRVRPEETGSAAGLLNAVQQLGATLGVASLGSVFFSAGAPTACWIAVALLAAAAVTGVGMTRDQVRASGSVRRTAAS
ncbi:MULTISPECIES: MFS transporter [unclassified Amycolatopsis]|uniref:MFS transporter n=1 Tax=unclassified Amycolatopsis TaxID=2618356 RepID=UPI001C6A3236|nr:MFS transporter [Amycolatopsis sp. DSM 110486]QYN16940.1 MFS transporter [Amycolatopsis sp. DSM 110486]